MARVLEVGGGERTAAAKTLEQFQNLVGGPVELVNVHRATLAKHHLMGKLVLVNEEGVMRGMPANNNPLALELAKSMGYLYFRGQVVICKEEEFR